MANKKLLQEAIQAFANGENAVADKKLRKYFIETAQEINKQLEEEMEAEECEEISEAEEVEDCEEVVAEDIHSGQSEDLTGEIQYALGEAEDEDVEADAEEIGVDGSEEFEAEDDVEVESGDLPTQDQWASIKDAIDSLSKRFDEIEGEGEVDLDVEGDDVGDEEEISDFEIDDAGEEEFGDVQFGDEKFGESYKMKPVSKPSNDAAKSKSPVAPNAKSPVAGVDPVKIKDGNVVTNDGDLLKNKDADTAKVEDMNNVMDNAKGLMKDVKKPANKADKSKSVVPTKAPKF